MTWSILKEGYIALTMVHSKESETYKSTPLEKNCKGPYEDKGSLILSVIFGCLATTARFWVVPRPKLAYVSTNDTNTQGYGIKLLLR